MSSSPLHIRRATVDDLPALRSLWARAGWPVDELEARLKEFHAVEARGEFVGALGVQFVGANVRFHSEDYTDFALADAARELFWAQLQKLAAHHGVFRVWTQETSPFWTHWGFQPANTEQLARLPDEWKTSGGRWLTLELKSEDAINTALAARVGNFTDAGKQQAERRATQGRKVRIWFTVLFFAIGLIGIALAVYLLLRHPLNSG